MAKDPLIQSNAAPSLPDARVDAPEVSGYGYQYPSQERYRAFQVKPSQNPGKVTVDAGSVNNITPTIGGTAIGSSPNPELDLSGLGDSVAIVIFATVDILNVATFGDLIDLTIAAYDSAAVPDSSFENPVQRIATATLTNGLLRTIVQEVQTSLNLIRWYDTNVWLPA